MMTEHVLVEKSSQLLTLTLNRPEKKNALTVGMYATLAAQINASNDDPDIRCLLLQANGDMFTAGNDLADFAAINNTLQQEPMDNPFLLALAGATKPLVAAVNGRSVGIGLTMLLHCDLVFVAEDAVLTAPFVNLALVPEAASSVLLPLRIGHVRAFEIFALGEPVTAQKAVEWGIANRAVATAELRQVARAAALALAARSPGSVLATKRLMRDAPALREQMSAEQGHFVRQLKSPQFKEAFAAFTERRAPDFSKFK